MTIDFFKIEQDTNYIDLKRAKERTNFLFNFYKKIKQVNIHYNGELTQYFDERLKKLQVLE